MREQQRVQRPTGFLWWVAAFAAVMALAEVWEGDFQRAGAIAALAVFLAILAQSDGAPQGGLRLLSWALLIVIAASALVRLIRLVS